MTNRILLTTDVEDSDVITDKHKYITNGVNSNDLYFYSDVSNESVFVLNKSIMDLTKQLLITQVTFDLVSPPPIKLYINSDGGEIFSALSTVDRIQSNKIPIHSYVEGLVASAATLISISCHTRYINKNSIMLVHQLRSWFTGTHENFKDESHNLEVLSSIIKNIYLKHSKFTASELDELLKRDIYLNAEDAVKYGLADIII